MSLKSWRCRFHFWVLVLLDLFSEALCEYCGDDKYCHLPFKCCANKIACCSELLDKGYSDSRGLRLQVHVWNMWYFWLIIIFILMSCFGGCGYYRRRRLAALHLPPVTPSMVSHRSARISQTRMPPSDQLQHTSFYAYSGPGVDVLHGPYTGPGVDVFLHGPRLPPPYSEVMQQPGLYPVSKVELPPYPGPPARKESCRMMRENEISPPSYSEVTALGLGTAEGSDVSISQDGEVLPMIPVQQSCSTQRNAFSRDS